jgi:hypothetical protein
LVDKKINIRVTTKGAQKAQSAFKDIGSSLLKIGVIAGTAALAIKGVLEVVERAGKMQGVERAFKRTTISLKELRDATRDTISDFELMQRAVMAENLGVPIEQLADLFKFASIRARETGESVDFLVNSIVTGIGRKSVLILDNLGISATEVNAKFKEMGDFGAAVGEIVNRELQEMDENIAPLADNVDRLTSSFSELYDEVIKVLGAGAEKGGVIGFFADMVSGLADYVSFWYGTGSRVFGETTKALQELGETDFPEEVFSERVAITFEYAKAWAQVGENLRMVAKTSEHTFAESNKDVGKFVTHIETTAEKLSGLSNQLINTFDYVFTETLIREKNFGDAMVAGFASMLERMVAQMAAKAAVFGVLSAFTQGAFAPIGGVLNFITGGIFGQSGGGMSPAHGGSGGSSVNIHMPNVTMINSRSIGQLKQALTLHDRRH